ncbi:MAG: amidohydrolase family protein [Rhodobacteraceae bacterium]|jgi:N-acetylglucosamine-6-phosphate deacetylase|nr:amidohydrolase family protein [Paracoccaceae bacterium]
MDIAGTDPGTGAPLVVTVQGPRIARVEPGGPGGPYLAPGLVDLQVNGFGGHDLNDGHVAPATVIALCRRLLAGGVTRFLPTVVTASEPAILQALAAIATAADTDPVAGAMIAGVHVEGPSVDPADGPRGAHPLPHVRPPDLAEVARWQAAAGGRVRIVTLSPHWDGALDAIRGLAAQGIVAAIGHTGADPGRIRAAAEAGAVMSTHLGNGVAGVLPRHPNLIWAQLDDDRLTASVIADGHHLPADTLRVFLRAKGLDRTVLVSDAVALAGMPPGRYRQPVGGEVELTADGRLGMAGTPYLAGAARGLADGVAEAVRMTGLPLGAVLPMATRNPARLLGGGGEVAVGARADLIAFDHAPGDRTLAIRGVWLAGERMAP